MGPVAACGDLNLPVTFSTTDVFNPGNVFTVELSDSTGSFALPTVIGSAVGTGAGSISCTFPAGIGGGGWAIRVTASDPAQIGDAYALPITTVVPPNAGLSSAVTVCSNSGPVQLLNLLAGSPDVGGTWSGPLGPMNGTFDPAADPAGPYQYVVDATPPCLLETAILSVAVVLAPNAGTSNSITVCSSDPPFILLNLLDGSPQVGGSWTSLAGNPSPNFFLPGTDMPGCYTYTVPGMAPCANDAATLCIMVTDAIDPGEDFTITQCGGPPIDMQAGLLPGGTWTYLGVEHSNLFTPGVDPPGSYVYTMPPTPSCSGASVTATMLVYMPPNAGGNATVNWCASFGALDLFAQLGGNPDPGGAWTDDSGTGALSGDMFDPAGVPSGTYTFTYTVMVNGVCLPGQATVTVVNTAVCMVPPQTNDPVE
ncbi:MAG: hypothetical protein KIT10_13655 [Flavobacteriales bacterium]|nr:hypothetical protein [Flavobacteriales bacterium]